MMFKKFFSLFSNDLAIDLGTANTLVVAKDRGIVINEATEMLGRTPGSITAIRPMRDGVIADCEVTPVMLRHFIKKATSEHSLFRPRIIICIPFGITQVENRGGKRECSLVAFL